MTANAQTYITRVTNFTASVAIENTTTRSNNEK